MPEPDTDADATSAPCPNAAPTPATASAKADKVFASVQASFGSHPEFQANAQPIRDAIAAFLANPKAAVPVLSVISTFLPPQGQVIINGIIGMLNVIPAQTNSGPVPSP